MREAPMSTTSVQVPAGNVTLYADLLAPPRSEGLIAFAHGSGSSRFSPRNRAVARTLVERGFAALLLDLLTDAEAKADEVSGAWRFDIPLLSGRMIAAVDWAAQHAELGALPIGCFGASTGAAAALVAAAARPEAVHAVVSRGGRPDLAGDALPLVRCPTLLIVGGRDHDVLAMNRDAAALMTAHATVEVVPGATHLFEEPGTLAAVADLAADWFERYLVSAPGGPTIRPTRRSEPVTR